MVVVLVLVEIMMVMLVVLVVEEMVDMLEVVDHLHILHNKDMVVVLAAATLVFLLRNMVEVEAVVPVEQDKTRRYQIRQTLPVLVV